MYRPLRAERSRSDGVSLNSPEGPLRVKWERERVIEIACFVKDAASLLPSVFVVSCFYYACIPTALQTHTNWHASVHVNILHEPGGQDVERKVSHWL